jgi:uncharacterized RDD family membrane protein YckC
VIENLHVDPAPEQRYGGLHLRLAAGLVDLLAGQALFFLLIAINGMWSGLLDIALPERPLTTWVNCGVMWLYFAVFESSSRWATPGKMLFRLVVTDKLGRRLSFARAAIRFLLKVISACSLAGVLVIPFNRRRRGLHDVLAGTLVIERNAGGAGEPWGAVPASTGTAVARAGPRWSVARVAMAAAAAAVLALFVVWQYSAWNQERTAQLACLQRLQQDLAKAQVAERKWAQFQEEVARLETSLRKVERMLPARLDVASFRKSLDGELAGKGLVASVLSVRTFRRGRLFRAELRMDVAGDPAPIAEILGRSCCGGRVTSWKGSYTPDGVSGALSIYATPTPTSSQSACGARRSDLWLWPFSARARGLAEEVERARTGLAPLKDASDGVRRYELLKQDLEDRVTLLNGLRQPEHGHIGNENEPEVPVEEEPRSLRS